MARPESRQGLGIVLVTETFPPEINGVAMTLHRLVTALSVAHRVTVVRPRQPEDRTTTVGADQRFTEVLRPGFCVPRSGFRFGLPSYSALARAWKATPPDVVHIATEGPLGSSALTAAERLGIPVTTSYHTNFHDYSRYYGLGLFHGMVSNYLRRFHNRARRTMVPSMDLLRVLERDGYSNLALFGRGVDTELFDPRHRDRALRQSWGLDDNGLAVIHVGRIAPEKNMPLAFAAFDRIRARRRDARLVVVGDGPMRQEYARLRPDAIFTGKLPARDLASHYASADLFVFPSMSETFGNVLIEAMASGLATVSFDYAAPRRYIQNAHNGWLASFGDAASFLDIAEGAGASCRTLRIFGQRARTAALGIPWQAVFAQFEREIRGAIAEHRAGAESFSPIAGVTARPMPDEVSIRCDPRTLR